MSRGWRAALLSFMTAALPALSPGQSAPDPRWRLSLAAGVAHLPNGLSSQCNTSTGAPAPEFGAALIGRIHRWALVQLDARVLKPLTGDCAGVGKTVDTNYAAGLRSDLLETTTLRLGAEVPAPFATFRATVGMGRGRAETSFPLTVIALSISKRGPGARAFVEIERIFTHFDAEEVYDFPLPRGSAPIVVHDVLLSVRAGIALPLRW